MAAYLLIDIEIIDSDKYTTYINKVKNIITLYGGKYIVRTNKIFPFSGDWKPDRVIIIKFPSVEKINECFASEEYIAIQSLRETSTKGKSIILED